MNKETVSYVRHIMSSDFVQLDIFNAMLAFAIIIVSFIAFIIGKSNMFGTAFILGAVLAFFNLIKSFMKRSLVGALFFGMIIPILAVGAFVIYRYVPA